MACKFGAFCIFDIAIYFVPALRFIPSDKLTALEIICNVINAQTILLTLARPILNINICPSLNLFFCVFSYIHFSFIKFLLGGIE